MLGQMMPVPLNIHAIITHAARNFPDQQVVSIHESGSREVATYSQVELRCRRMASALARLGVRPGDRIASMAWNTQRHLELYYAVPGMGAVLHTLNPRLTLETLAFIVLEAKDRILLFEPEFAPFAKALTELGVIETFVVMGDESDVAALDWPGLLAFDDLIERAPPLVEWPALDENSAAGLCYTSGTTGNPKGVLYSHRSTVLHALVCGLPTNINLTEADCVVPVVPMFHVNAWGLPHIAPLVGSRLVLPRDRLDGESLERLFIEEKVTAAAGVPTLWQGLARQLEKSDAPLPHLRRLMVGGAALPASLQDFFEDRFDVEIVQGWGMTETSPLCSFGSLGPGWEKAGTEASKRQKLKQGRPLFAIDMKLADGASPDTHSGELLVRGPWIASHYFGTAPDTAKQWFPTGDIAEFDDHGYLQLTDRAKDLIKSGGEWISSVELEERAYDVDGVAQAAAIAVPDEKWGERPLLVIVPKPHSSLDADIVRARIGKGLARWQVPERIEFIDQMPIGPTGKILKKVLRERYAAPSK